MGRGILVVVEIHWRDTDLGRLPLGEWRALQFVVRGAPRPRLAVNTCDPLCIRLTAGSTPLLWARIEDDYWGYDILRSRQTDPVRVIPPILFDLVDQHSGKGDDAARDRAWARVFTEGLAASDASPLSDGSWLLGYYDGKLDTRNLPPALVHQIVKQRSYGYVQWDFGDAVYPVTLRNMSDPDDGRVKAWRKHARASSLPPILLYWVSGLAAYVVLDGHDRLLAASLEDAAAPALCLEVSVERETDQATKDAVLEQVARALEGAQKERARAQEERLARARRLITVDGANELLLLAFVPRLHGGGSTRARPLVGGTRQWAREVRSELALQGVLRRALLEGLEEQAGDGDLRLSPS